MNAKIFDAVREIPINEVPLSEYCSVEEAAQSSGIPEATLWQHIHRSRRVGSAIIGNSRLVLRADVLALAESLGVKAHAPA